MGKLSDWFWKSPIGESLEESSEQTEKWAKIQLTLLTILCVLGLGIFVLLFRAVRKMR